MVKHLFPIKGQTFVYAPMYISTLHTPTAPLTEAYFFGNPETNEEYKETGF